MKQAALLRCDESTVYAAVVLACAVILFFAALRAVVFCFSRLVSRVTDAYLAPWLEHCLCAVTFVVSVVLFADGSALLPGLLLLTSLTSCAFCHSWKSLRWLWVSSFVFYSALLLNVVGPLLAQDVDIARLEWTTLVRDQRIFLPSLPDGATPRSLFSYYDGATIEGSASPVARAAAATPSLSLPAAAMPAWLRAMWGLRQGRKSACKRNATACSEEASAPTFSIVASGDDTVLRYHATHMDGNDFSAAADSVGLVDSVHLMGQRSRLEHSELHCWSSTSTASPCLRLRRSATLWNVTIRWAETASDAAGIEASSPPALVWHSLEAGQAAAQSCTEVQRLLALQLEERNTVGVAAGDGSAAGVATSTALLSQLLLDCVEDMEVQQLPAAFVARAPLAVQFGWRFPGYLHRLQEAFLFLFDNVVMPLSWFWADVLHALGRIAAAAFASFGTWFVEALPHVIHGAEQVAVYAGGLACGGATPRGASNVDAAAAAQARLLHTVAPSPSRCAAFARSHASHAAFVAGVRTRKSAATAFSTVADALDLVPGVWSLYSWAWNAELSITMWIVNGLRAVGYFVVYVAPQPLMRFLSSAFRLCAVGLPKLAAPVQAVWRWLPHVSVLPYVSRAASWLWALEKRSTHYEWLAVKALAGFVASRSEVALQVVWRWVLCLSNWTAAFLKQYNRTSLSSHLVVVVLQTVLLLIAMRNEMRELVEAERQRAAGPYSPLRLAARFFPQAAAQSSLWQSFTAHLNGIVLLVRAHHSACMNYVLLHSVGLLVLIGLSVLPFTNKLYSLSLRYVIPWLSAKAFLTFFTDPPSSVAAAVLVMLRMVLSTVLQQTLGEFLYHVVRDVLIAVGLFGSLALLLWAWPHRSVLARQVATAIADSLQVTPATTPQRGTAAISSTSPHDATPEAAEAHDSPPPRGPVGDEGGAMEEAPMPDAPEQSTPTRDRESVTKQIDLTEAL